MPGEEAVLLERWVARRDPEAFDELVSRYAGLVHATCRRILANEARRRRREEEYWSRRRNHRHVGKTCLKILLRFCLLTLTPGTITTVKPFSLKQSRGAGKSFKERKANYGFWSHPKDNHQNNHQSVFALGCFGTAQFCRRLSAVASVPSAFRKTHPGRSRQSSWP